VADETKGNKIKRVSSASQSRALDKEQIKLIKAQVRNTKKCSITSWRNSRKTYKWLSVNKLRANWSRISLLEMLFDLLNDS